MQYIIYVYYLQFSSSGHKDSFFIVIARSLFVKVKYGLTGDYEVYERERNCPLTLLFFVAPMKQ